MDDQENSDQTDSQATPEQTVGSGNTPQMQQTDVVTEPITTEQEDAQPAKQINSVQPPEPIQPNTEPLQVQP